MNKNTIRRRVMAAARAAPRRPALYTAYRDVTAVVTSPALCRFPVWSPGPGWVEVRVASLWARSGERPDRLDVLTVDLDWDTRKPIVATAAIPRDQLATIDDKPHKLPARAEEGTFAVTSLPEDHPGARYHDLLCRLGEWLDELSSQAGRLGIIEDTEVRHTADGHLVITVNAPVYEDTAAEDSADLAWLFDHAARIAGEGARVRVLASAAEHIRYPLGSWVWPRLEHSSDPVETKVNEEENTHA